jgi:hypothetical protein
MHVAEYALFPTRLLTIQLPDVAGLNRDLAALFATRQEFHDDFNMHPDAQNLLRLADTCPALAQLRRLFLEGLRRWLGAEGIEGCLGAEVVLFSNYSTRGDFTLVHNHNADVVGVYYVRTAEYDRPAVFVPGPDSTDDYFAAEDGALMLHDPRFNANLAAVGVRDYVKVFPRPGLLVLFPGYLWHSVTPHASEGRRLAISANFRLRWNGQANAEFCPLGEER